MYYNSNRDTLTVKVNSDFEGLLRIYLIKAGRLIYVPLNYTIIDVDNALSHVRYQAIIWANAANMLAERIDCQIGNDTETYKTALYYVKTGLSLLCGIQLKEAYRFAVVSHNQKSISLVWYMWTCTYVQFEGVSFTVQTPRNHDAFNLSGQDNCTYLSFTY